MSLNFNSFTMQNSEGKNVRYNILYDFASTVTQKDYVTFYDADTENAPLITAIYTLDEKGGFALTPIEDDSEWEIVNTILDGLQEQTLKKMLDLLQENSDCDEEQ